jgi:hypothetical protein
MERVELRTVRMIGDIPCHAKEERFASEAPVYLQLPP